MCNDSRIKSTRWQTNDLILYLRLCVKEWLKSTGIALKYSKCYFSTPKSKNWPPLDVPNQVSRRDRSNYVIFYACKLASALGDDEKKWEIMSLSFSLSLYIYMYVCKSWSVVFIISTLLLSHLIITLLAT